jgi:hypothetical protein
MLSSRRPGMQNRTVTPHGVFFTIQTEAETIAPYSDRDVVAVEGGWLARNRDLKTEEMPTRVGDVVVMRTGLVFNVWTVRADGAQEHDASVPPYQSWNWAHIVEAVENVRKRTRGRIFLASKRGWVLRDRM